MLADLPEVADAAAAGDIGPFQVRSLARLHANERCREHLPDSEQLLLDAARTLIARDFVKVCQRWEACADPDGAHHDHELSRENRRVSYSRIGTGFVMRIEGDALSGAVIKGILDEHAQLEFERDIAERSALHGQQAAAQPLPRSASQREFDALLVMCRKAPERNEPSDRKPLVNIFTTPDYLTNAIEAHRRNHDVRASNRTVRPITGYAETADGSPVDPHDLVTAALIGQVRRVVMDSAGRVIDLGRRARLFTGAAREAVLLSGDHCTQPGCESRGHRVEIDHLQAWAVAGPTDADNGDPRCRGHNRDKHIGKLTVTRDDAGWHTYRHDGTEIAPRYRPRRVPDDDSDSDVNC